MINLILQKLFVRNEENVALYFKYIYIEFPNAPALFIIIWMCGRKCFPVETWQIQEEKISRKMETYSGREILEFWGGREFPTHGTSTVLGIRDSWSRTFRKFKSRNSLNMKKKNTFRKQKPAQQFLPDIMAIRTSLVFIPTAWFGTLLLGKEIC